MDLLENHTVFAGAQNGAGGLGAGGWAYRGGEAARQRLQHPAAASVDTWTAVAAAKKERQDLPLRRRKKIHPNVI